MTCPPRFRVGPGILMLAWLALACSSPAWRVSWRPGDLTRIPLPRQGPVLVVAPPAVPDSWTSEDAFKRMSQLCSALGDAGWIVVAPWEYTQQAPLQRGEVDMDVLLRLNALGVDPARIWVLGVTIRESTATLTTDLDRGDDTATAYGHRRQIGVDLDLHDPRLTKVLARVAVTVDQNPFASGADVVDPLPALTEAIPAAVEVLDTALAAAGVVREEPASLDASVMINPRRLETFELRGHPSLEQRLVDQLGPGVMARRQADEASRTELLARKVTHYQFFDRDIDVARIEQLEALPQGTLVEDPGELAAWGIRAGDVLLSANGMATEGSHAVRRTRALLAPRMRIAFFSRGEERVFVVPER